MPYDNVVYTTWAWGSWRNFQIKQHASVLSVQWTKTINIHIHMHIRTHTHICREVQRMRLIELNAQHKVIKINAPQLKMGNTRGTNKEQRHDEHSIPYRAMRQDGFLFVCQKTDLRLKICDLNQTICIMIKRRLSWVLFNLQFLSIGL